MPDDRYEVIGQSCPCPDGYDRTIYYVWDHSGCVIAHMATTRAEADAWIIAKRKGWV